MKKRMTKKQQLALRQSSYTVTEPPAERCENCRHSWFGVASTCYAIEIRGDVRLMQIHRLGHCDLWEPQE
jgi:uncharacterized protein YpbB